MKILVHSLYLLAASFLFTGCFEITEDISLNADGSGDMLLTIDLSESKDNLAAFMSAGSIQGEKLPTVAEMEAEVLNIKKTLSKIKGLTNVETKSDFKQYTLKISGQFDKVSTLNKAINTVADELNRSPLPTLKKDNFAYKKGQFSRMFKYTNDLKLSEEEFKKLNFSARYVMESARYISIYRFKKAVSKFSNKKAQLSPSKKAIKLETTIADLIKGKASIENTISF